MTSCRVCATPFAATNSLHTICSVRCAIKLPKVNRAFEKFKMLARREAIKPRSKWLQEAQTAFNAWVRARDEKLPCISCGTFSGKRNACHYLSVGARPELRFDAQNVHAGCERCNTFLHGNLIMYRLGLLERIGRAGVESLEGPHEPKKYSIDDLRQIRDEYRARVKCLQL